MKKAIKAIAASIILLNTTSIVNHQPTAIHAMNPPVEGPQQPQPVPKQEPKSQELPKQEEIPPQPMNDTVIFKVAQKLKDEMLGQKKDVAKLGKNQLPDIIKSVIQPEIDILWNGLQKEIGERLHLLDAQLLSKLNHLTNEKADKQTKLLNTQIGEMKQLVYAVAQLLDGFNLGMGDMMARVQELSEPYEYKEKPITQENLDTIDAATTAFFTATEAIKNNAKTKETLAKEVLGNNKEIAEVSAAFNQAIEKAPQDDEGDKSKNGKKDPEKEQKEETQEEEKKEQGGAE